MFENVSVMLGYCLTLVGFLGVFVKIGIDKGELNFRIKSIEEKAIRKEEEIKTLHDEVHGLKNDFAGSFAGLKATVEYIKDSIDELKERIK